MTSSGADTKAPAAVSLEFSESSMTVELEDGRALTVPLDWYPRLVHATIQECDNWVLMAGGRHLHFPDLDEDLSVEALLAGKRSLEGQESLDMWLRAKSEGRPLEYYKLIEHEREQRKQS